MPNPALCTEESNSEGESERVLPAQPRQWAALPPTRHSLRSAATEGSVFVTTHTDLSEQLEQVRGCLSNIAGLQRNLLQEHRREVKQLSDENERLSSEVKRLGEQKMERCSDEDADRHSLISAQNPENGTDASAPLGVPAERPERRADEKQPDESKSTYMSENPQSATQMFKKQASKIGTSDFSVASDVADSQPSEGKQVVEKRVKVHSVLSLQSMTDGVDFHESFGSQGINSQGFRRMASKLSKSGSVASQTFQTLGSQSINSTPFEQVASADTELELHAMSHKGTEIGQGFILRKEWLMTDDDLFRVAAKGILENPSLAYENHVHQQSTVFSLGTRFEVFWHPEHRSRLCWDVVAAALLAYDTIMLPLHLMEIRTTDAMRVLDWITAAFWTLDIAASLCTGFFDKGRLEMRWHLVFKNYSKTWMVPDVLMISVEWILLIGYIASGNDSGVLSSFGAFRNIRVLRFVRLLRLVKFERLNHQLMRRINSIYLLLSMRIIKMLVAIIVANHIIACAWFAVGKHGWAAHLGFVDESHLMYAYWTSFHWSLTQFHGSVDIVPKSLKERLFAVLVLLTALVAFSWFLSNMTNSMIMLQSIHAERTSQQSSLLMFLSQRHVSKALTVRIKEFIAMHNRSPSVILEAEVKLLAALPRGLLRDLHAELRGRPLLDHPLFDHLNIFFPNFFQQLADEGVQEEFVCCNDIVFSTGEACQRIIFINSQMSYEAGNMRRPTVYISNREEILSTVRPTLARSNSRPLGDAFEVLSTQQWLSEAALWTTWENCGTLKALQDACFHILSVEQLLKTVMLYEQVRLDTSVYAKTFVSILNESSPSDLSTRIDSHKVWETVSRGERSSIEIRRSTARTNSKSSFAADKFRPGRLAKALSWF